MKHEEVLERAVRLAIGNGWSVNDWTDADDFTWDVQRGEYDELLMHYTGLADDWYLSVPHILFDPASARALWGEECKTEYVEPRAGTPTRAAQKDYYRKTTLAPWKRHLQQMVISDDPIRYLAEHLPETNP